MTSTVHSTPEQATFSQASSAALQISPVEKEMLLARLPIFDAAKETIGYQLLAHLPQSKTSAPDGSDSKASKHDEATSTFVNRHCIHQALHVIGLDQLLGQARLFIPMTAQNMLEQDYALLPPNQACLKLAANLPVTNDLIASCRHATEAGYQLALDMSPEDPHMGATPSPSIDLATLCELPLLEMAQIMLINLKTAAPGVVENLLIHQSTGVASLLATHVDTQEDVSLATRHGAQYVQGRFFCDPQHVTGRELVSSQVAQLKFLALLNEPKLDFDALEQTIKSDVALTCNLLRYLNSAAMGVKQTITSIKQALVLLGEKPMRQWGSLIAITALAGHQPHELLVTSLVRGKFCETLGRKLEMHEEALNLFLAGLLSTIDVMLEIPMENALASIPVSKEVRQVLSGDYSSKTGNVYQLVLASERGAWGSVIELANQFHLPHHEIASQYYETLQWTHDFFHAPLAA